MFKGLWMKHLQFYLDLVPDRAPKYASFIGAQESAVYHYGTGAEWTVGNVWYQANQGGSLFTAQTQVSWTARGGLVSVNDMPCRPRASRRITARQSTGAADVGCRQTGASLDDRHDWFREHG